MNAIPTNLYTRAVNAYATAEAARSRARVEKMQELAETRWPIVERHLADLLDIDAADIILTGEDADLSAGVVVYSLAIDDLEFRVTAAGPYRSAITVYLTTWRDAAQEAEAEFRYVSVGSLEDLGRRLAEADVDGRQYLDGDLP